MHRALLVAVGASLFACASKPFAAGPAEISPPVSALAPSDDTIPEAGGARLKKECEAGKALSCSVLAGAFTTGDSLNAPEIGRDLAEAAKYRVKGCQLGSGSDCSAAGDAYAEGKGVQQDKLEAIKFLRMSCDNYNTLTPFACSRMAQLLLDSDFLGNYDEAMVGFTRGCAGQQVLCKQAEFYKGTGLVPTIPPPTGAVGYSFGTSAAQVALVCSQQGGKFLGGANAQRVFCETPKLDALETRPRYVAFSICKSKTVCDINIAFYMSASEVYRQYFALKARLSEIYGTASKIVVSTTADCRNAESMAKCVRASKARFSSSWIWNEKGTVDIGILANDEQMQVMISYYNSESVQTLGAQGL